LRDARIGQRFFYAPELSFLEISIMHAKLETTLNISLTLSALAIAASVVYKTISPRSAPAAISTAPAFSDEWNEALAVAHLDGPANAPIVMLVFADFECPYYRQFDGHLAKFRHKYGSALSVAFVHYPLEAHRMAMPAARAAECAGDQNRFTEMQQNLFALQDSLGLMPWVDIAQRSLVPDIATFQDCFAKIGPVPRVAASKAIADRMGIRGTPMLVVNGWKFDGVPNDSLLEASIDLIRAGKSPASTFAK